MIPKRFHLIWMGKFFPLVYRLAIDSLVQSNPGAEVIIHFSDPPENEDWRSLEKHAELRPIDLKALIEPLGPEGPPIAQLFQQISLRYPAGKSNILRYLILFREGGIYLDFDTLTVRSFDPLLKRHSGFIGEEEVYRHDDDRVRGKWSPQLLATASLFGLSYGLGRINSMLLSDNRVLHSINRALMNGWSAKKLNNAVLACQAASPFFKAALLQLRTIDPGLRFGMGPMLMNSVWDSEITRDITRLGPHFFYPVPPSQTFRFFYGPARPLHPSTIVLHWVSSNHRKLASSLREKDILYCGKNPPLYLLWARKVLRGELLKEEG